jgi:FKBP-type peptidyl-prolyl cis-trans isomerase
MSDVFENDVDKLSYALGMDVAFSFKSLPTEINPEVLIEAFTATFAGDDTKMSQENYAEEMQKFQDVLQQKRAEMQEQMLSANKEAGEKFLEQNQGKDGVSVTESGLQYEVLEAGDGDKPTADSTVEVHYTGSLIDGTVFDSSVQRGETIEFPLNGVIPGWTEGLQLMSVGSKYRFTIPSNLAYGERGAGQQIPPHSTLVFDVELIDIK